MENKGARVSVESGINPVLVIPILGVLAFIIWKFVMGASGNFENLDPVKGHPNGFLGTIYKGGFIVPILITFMFTVIVFSIERFMSLSKANGSGDLTKFVNDIRQSLSGNNPNEAITICDQQKGSIGNVVREGLETYKTLQKDTTTDKEHKLAILSKSIDEATTLEMPGLEQNLTILSTLASVATLVALLGTVIGMIKAFNALGSGGGSPDAGALSVGISEALINTALGIGTSAVAIIMYNYFTSRVDSLTFKIDEVAMSLQESFNSHH